MLRRNRSVSNCGGQLVQRRFVKADNRALNPASLIDKKDRRDGLWIVGARDLQSGINLNRKLDLQLLDELSRCGFGVL